MNKYKTIIINYSENVRENGKPVIKEKLLECIGKSERIYQYRIDNATSYTSKLTNRFSVTIDDEYDLIAYQDLNNNNINKVTVRTFRDDSGDEYRDIDYALLSINQTGYNTFILELGEVK